MKFIGVLLLLIYCQGHPAERETVAIGHVAAVQLIAAECDDDGPGNPETMRDDIMIGHHRIIKKAPGICTLPSSVFTPSYVYIVTPSAVPDPGIHVKNYLRHNYPSMHYW